MREIGCARNLLLDHRNAEGLQELKRVRFRSDRSERRACARRAPGEVGGEGIRAGFRGAEGGDAARGEQCERALGVRREESGEWLVGPLRAKDRLDGGLRV